MRTLQQQIAANRRASWFYAALIVLLLAALGGAIGGYYAPAQWYFGAILAAGVGLIVAFVARFQGAGIILSISGAREATQQEDRMLRNVAEEMAIAAGVPMPKVYVIDDSAPNAFATGMDPKDGIVVVTTGLLQKLNRDELQGVVAHEIAHIRNEDIRFMTSIALIAGLIPLIADMFGRSLWYGGGSRRRNNDQGQIIFLVIALILAVVAPLFAMMLQMAVSRQREYLADASAAEFTRYPEGLANALLKLANDHEPLEAANRATQHLFIVSPLKKFHEGMDSMFSTHPPIQERVNRLRGLMGQHRGPAVKGGTTEAAELYDPLRSWDGDD